MEVKKKGRVQKNEIVPNQLFIALLSIAGLVVSIYALMIEYEVEASPEYKPMCDINQYMSCSAPLTSIYGKGFGLLPSSLAIRNPYFGILFYSFVIMLSMFPAGRVTTKLLIVMTVLSNLMSIYLGSILLLVIQSICLVCVTTYVINFLLLIFAVRYHRSTVRYLEALRKHD